MAVELWCVLGWMDVATTKMVGDDLQHVSRSLSPKKSDWVLHLILDQEAVVFVINRSEFWVGIWDLFVVTRLSTATFPAKSYLLTVSIVIDL